MYGTIKLLLPLAVLIAAVAMYFGLGLDRFMSFEMLRENRFTLLAFVDDNKYLAMASFVSIYAAFVAMSVPGAVFLTLTGGFLFGVAKGSFCVVVGATMGAALLFIVARSASPLADPLRARAGPWLRAFEKGFQENAFHYLLVLRLVPIFPFFVVNLVPAFLGISLRTYVAATFIGIIPAVVIFSAVGAGLGTIFDAGETFTAANMLTPQILGGLSGLAALALLPVAYKKMRRRSGG